MLKNSCLCLQSLMTALMYKKPEDHIKFLEECLSKAETEKKIQWHTFLDPLPPIPKTNKKICSENEEQLQTRNSASSLAKHTSPLPPISHHESNHSTESVVLKDEADPRPKEQGELYDTPPAEIDSVLSIDDDTGFEEKVLPTEVKEELQMKLSESAENEVNSVESFMQIKAPVIFVIGEIT